MTLAHQFIGLGAEDPKDNSIIVPIATFPAQPNSTTTITPHNKYYITWGDYTSGQIIDTTTTTKATIIDFTGKQSTLAKVTHNNDGSWTVIYN